MVQGVTDDCDAGLETSVVVERVTSDEPDDDPDGGDGNTTQDMVIATDRSSVSLRVERNESLNGRVYNVVVRVTDASGNTTRANFKVSVPIGRKGDAVEDAVANVVSG
jgi:hypothetical protein